MGAYENPITVIDTESAKMWQQASANIAQFSINAMNTINARKTKEAKEQEAEATDRTAMAIENQQAVIDRITRAGVKSDAYFQYGMALMDDVTRLQGDLKYFSGTEEEKSAMLSELSDKQKNISQLVTQGAEVQDAIGDYLKRRGIGKDGKEASPDTPNGMVMVGDEKMVRYHKIMGALSGLDKGTLDSVYMKNGALYAKIEGIEGEVNLSTEIKYDTGEVIDSSKLIKDALVAGGVIDNKNNYNQKKYLNQDLVDVVDSKTPTGKTIQKTVVPYDIDRITTDALMAINNEGLAVLKSWDENSIRGWYMLRAGENGGKLNFVNEVGGVNKTLDEESTKKWLDVWNKEGKSQIPNYVEITEENVDQFNDAVVGQYRLNLQDKQTDAKLVTPPTKNTIEIYGNTVNANYSKPYNDFLEFQANPIDFFGDISGATLTRNGNILTLTNDNPEEGENPIIDQYNMNNAMQVDKLFDALADKNESKAGYGTKDKDVIRRDQFKQIIRFKNKYDKNNPDPNALTPEQIKAAAEKAKQEKIDKAYREAIKREKGEEKAENYREVKYNQSATSLNYLTRKDGDEVLVTPKDKNKSIFTPSKPRDELVLEIYNKKTGEYTPLTVKKVDKYQDDVGEGLKEEFNNLFNKKTSETQKNATFKEFLSTLSIKQAAEGKNAKNIRAYINTKTPPKTIKQLISEANKEGKNLPKFSAFTDEDQAILDEFAKSKSLKLQLNDDGDLVFKKIEINSKKKPGE